MSAMAEATQIRVIRDKTDLPMLNGFGTFWKQFGDVSGLVGNEDKTVIIRIIELIDTDVDERLESGKRFLEGRRGRMQV